MDTQKQPLPTGPAENFPEIRDVLKAHGVSLSEVTYTVECRCDRCGALWSSEASLDDPLEAGWWQCWKCDTAEGVELKDVVNLAFHECFERRQYLPEAEL